MKKKLTRALWIALAAVVAIGLLAPYLNANRLRPRIQAALETAFHRPVEIGAVHLNLFSGPGFTVQDVVIDDDPPAGIEPFAHVESMQARIRWLSLLRGKLAFSTLRMDSPSVNLVRLQAGPWNIQQLLSHSSGTNSTKARDVPDIQIRDGRLNFKFGDTKSVFYISAADIDAYPNESGDVVIRFSGAPARTDRGGRRPRFLRRSRGIFPFRPADRSETASSGSILRVRVVASYRSKTQKGSGFGSRAPAPPRPRGERRWRRRGARRSWAGPARWPIARSRPL